MQKMISYFKNGYSFPHISPFFKGGLRGIFSIVILILLIFSLSCSTIFGILGAVDAQKQKNANAESNTQDKAILKGKVFNTSNVPLEHITVSVSWDKFGNQSDSTIKSGAYFLKGIPFKEVTLTASGQGYNEYKEVFEIKEKEIVKDIILTPIIKENQAPIIEALNVTPLSIKKGENVEIKTDAYDPDGNVLNYKWETSGGVLSSDTGQKINWIASSEGVYKIQVTVSDNKNATAIGTVNIVVDAEGKGSVQNILIPSPSPSIPPQISPSVQPSPTPTISPAINITPIPTPIKTSTVTPTPSKTPSIFPTPTITPTPTSTPSSTASPSVLPSSVSGKIVFSSWRYGQPEIYVMNADGTNQIRLTNNSADDWHPSWSPDGSKIVFYSNMANSAGEIYIINADGSNLTRLTNNSNTDMYPTWSPDGTKIAFISDRDGYGSSISIYVMNTDGSNPIKLTNNIQYQKLSWSPDGTKIAFISDRDGNGEIYVMNADGTNQTRLTNNSANDTSPNWSPDGIKIAFSSDRDCAPCNEIYLMNADGTNQTRLTNNSANDGFWLSWSPDGEKIIFNSTRENATFKIFVMNADGSNQTKLIDDIALYPSWSR